MKVGLSCILVFVLSFYTLQWSYFWGVYCLRHIQLKEEDVCLFFLILPPPPPLFSEAAAYSIFLNRWISQIRTNAAVFERSFFASL